MIPFETGPVSYLPLLLCRLIGSEAEADLDLPLPVLINLAKGRFKPVYHLLMSTAVEQGWGHFEGRMPWQTEVGGWYDPENYPSHTFGFAVYWPDGAGWMNEYFVSSSKDEQATVNSYAKMGESMNSHVGHSYEITEPLVALFFALCYAADRGVSGNEAWLHKVATSQRIRWEGLLDSELYRDCIAGN
jgi:hypothetical protein